MLAEDIYTKLFPQTATGNVVIKSVYQQRGLTYAKSIGGIFSLRVRGLKYHFGNPYSSIDELVNRDNLIKTKTVKESVVKFIDWVLFSEDDRAIWIRNQCKQETLRNKPIVYYKELYEPSHANALDYLINKYDWSEL